ncbi:MAG: hypothetical protein ACTSQA_08545, partial [Candidatus Heimdallarchaeaceae archaeon]
NPLRIVIANLPPPAKKLFKEDLYLLTNSVPTQQQVEDIFNKIHDWVYTEILTQGFKIKPFSQTEQINFEEIELKLD